MTRTLPSWDDLSEANLRGANLEKADLICTGSAVTLKSKYTDSAGQVFGGYRDEEWSGTITFTAWANATATAFVTAELTRRAVSFGEGSDVRSDPSPSSLTGPNKCSIIRVEAQEVLLVKTGILAAKPARVEKTEKSP